MAALQSPKTSSRRSKGDGDGDTRDVILGKYTKIEEIGRGSFATVYQGIHNKYRSCVAIKAIATSQHHASTWSWNTALSGTSPSSSGSAIR
ncbi:ULK3 protein [Coccidioides immitis RMSCC 2394]|uniref:ULK3 protein n=1 Tax=Coccidioides immitis RMSCC 2394 TaxID=404692 RepID=A0A0J6YD43_COCIT|nr:ULK3 protein [Coccidioides immitis RMSCC 2394]